MAAIVSHAMRRFPGTSPDTSYSSYRFRGESSRTSEGESALSRSMRYADPWLYSSIAPVAAAGLLLAPALVLCSCPDYINGTKRGTSKKSPTACKKCKGTRLPLSALESSCKFGTVRCYPTSAAHSASTPLRAGTVRVTSSNARPSILPTAPDPYDLMRRSRLSVQATPDPRTRSVSPKAKGAEKGQGNQVKLKGTKQDPPYITSNFGGRRSILECDINPYELVSSDDALKSKDASITRVNGQRIRVRPTTASENDEYEDVEVKQPKKEKQKYASLKGKKSKKKQEELTPPLLVLKSPPSSPKLPESDLASRFKSILKKPTSFGESDASPNLERSPSPTATKNGSQKSSKSSQFYLPTPNTTPRKKVQFLVESEPELEEEIKVLEGDSDRKIKAEEERSPVRGDGKRIEVEPSEKKICTLRRSNSDSVVLEQKLNDFNDTMAIRRRKLKTNLKTAFKDLEKLDGVSDKPKKPISIKSEEPKEVEREAEVKADSKQTKCELDEKVLLEKLDKCIAGDESKVEDVVVVVEDPSTPPLVPPRKRSNNKLPQLNVFTSPEVLPLVPISIEKCDENDTAISITPTTLETPSPAPVNVEPSNRTVLQVNASPTVHKIQIKNEYSDVYNGHYFSVLDNPQRKTSIMINGDDCYSTVNVSDNVPLYQSSVVVNDSVLPFSPSKKSSTIYITGSFFPKQADISETSDEPIKNVTSEEKTITDEVNTQQSSEILTELLRNPVEAVRRNLVPHVCGKSDMSRRPCDKKLHQNPDPLLEEKSIAQNSLEESFSKLRNYESVCDDISSEHSSSTQYELMDPGSDCYTDHSNRSSVTEEELANRTKFYELLAESASVEVSESEDHQYESIKMSSDPIYEEIEIPPPLPSNPPPPALLDDLNLDKEYTTRSIFEGASKYDILSYLVDAKERGIVPEDSYTYSSLGHNGSITEEDTKDESLNRVSQLSTVSDSSEDNSLIMSGVLIDDKTTFQKNAEVERNDSGVGSETSKSSLSKYRTKQEVSILCEDCESTLETKGENEPLLCWKCLKKRSERKEIITEIVETEEKYSKDLQIILEEFYQPMLVAGLLTPEQLSAIFLNVEELLENSQALAERLRDAVEIALEQGDDDLLTINIGKLFLEATPMLHAFETYCVRQGAASLLLASLEKEKELLRIFLRVSQMENTMLRRMNLNSFLMVPVQRVTKYPLLLARLYKVTPAHLYNKDELKEAQHKIELHLNHMNSETKDVPSKLWRRIGSNSGRRSSTEMDLVNIKLRKIAVDVLEWNHEEAKFALEGKLLFTQPTDNNWRKGRTIKLAPVNALLVINGKPSNKTSERTEENGLIFSKPGMKEAALLLVRDKNGRYSLLREPLYLDRCIIAADPAWQSYFEVQELLGKDTFIFKAEDEEQTQMWYKQLQFHAQGLGSWRKRRNALANIMINGMGLRS